MRSVEAVALTRSVQATLAPVRTTEDIDRLLTALAREVAGGVIVLPSVTITANRGQIIALAARHRLPVIYPFPYFAAEGGLVSYGVDLDDLFRRAAGYLDRILKGAQASELPVQAPVKFQLVANMRAAKEIGITIPESVLARADEVIE
jgi:putative ABC transport system substrate-binding protein